MKCDSTTVPINKQKKKGTYLDSEGRTKAASSALSVESIKEKKMEEYRE